jgi:hypothetical protein
VGGPLVVALDVADAGIGEQRPQQAYDEARPEVGDVGIDPHHDVALGHVQRAPQRLALARPAGHVGQHLGGADHPRPGGFGHLGRVVGGVVVHDQHLVHQAEPVHQVAAHLGHDRAHGVAFVVRGDAHRHRLVALGVDQPVQRKVAVVPAGDRHGRSVRCRDRR